MSEHTCPNCGEEIKADFLEDPVYCKRVINGMKQTSIVIMIVIIRGL